LALSLSLALPLATTTAFLEALPLLSRRTTLALRAALALRLPLARLAMRPVAVRLARREIGAVADVVFRLVDEIVVEHRAALVRMRDVPDVVERVLFLFRRRLRRGLRLGRARESEELLHI